MGLQIQSDDPAGLDAFSAVAAHEAAHATVTAALRIAVTRILVVQRSNMERLAYYQHQPKEDRSHSQPDPQQYNDAGPSKQCVIARAGEVGQRIHLDVVAVLSHDQWSADFADIKRASNLSGSKLDWLVDSLGTNIENWLKEPEPNRICKNLTEVLIDRREPLAQDPDRFRTALEKEELQKILKDTPEFPPALVPGLP